MKYGTTITATRAVRIDIGSDWAWAGLEETPTYEVRLQGPDTIESEPAPGVLVGLAGDGGAALRGM